MTARLDNEPLTHWEGEPVRVWEEVWGIRELEAWPSLNSTNDRVLERARGGAGPWTVVVAEAQRRGRGRSRSPWHSPPGMGLWMSFLVRRHAAGGGLLSPLLAGLAVARAIESVAAVRADLKWPNDVWTGGRKVAGVLCESAGQQVVVGVGLNVRQREGDFPPELRAHAGSVEMSAGRPVGRPALAGALLAHARRLLDRPVVRLDDDLLAEIGRRDALRERRVRVDGVLGRALGVDAQGRLQVEVGPGIIRPVQAGHVELIEPEMTREGAE